MKLLYKETPNSNLTLNNSQHKLYTTIQNNLWKAAQLSTKVMILAPKHGIHEEVSLN